MAIYAVIAPEENVALAQRIAVHFANKHFKIADGQFLISSDLPTSKVADELTAASGALGRVLVARISNYNGWHSKDMWEWLASQNMLPGTDPLASQGVAPHG